MTSFLIVNTAFLVEYIFDEMYFSYRVVPEIKYELRETTSSNRNVDLLEQVDHKPLVQPVNNVEVKRRENGSTKNSSSRAWRFSIKDTLL